MNIRWLVAPKKVGPKVWNSALVLYLRNLLRENSKAIAALIGPLIGARVAQWMGVAIPASLADQFGAGIVLAVIVWLSPSNKPPVAAIETTAIEVHPLPAPSLPAAAVALPEPLEDVPPHA